MLMMRRQANELPKVKRKNHRQRNVLVKLREVDKRGRPSMVGLAVPVPDKSTADSILEFEAYP